ncbi:transposase [Asticcacaulis sp.]|uniref:transposase n=1 Tax=Asticcacaulis sp. TaxID=1872648 RepID=UPI0026136573|nr:transposase [Asticcacaulis sp.]
MIADRIQLREIRGFSFRLLGAISAAYDSNIVMIDSTCFRVHQHAATGKRGWRRWRHGTFTWGPHQQNPRARRCEGRPVHLRLSAGQVADRTEADALTEDHGEGAILLADKGYDSNAIRAKAAERKGWANIPPKANRKGSFVFSSWVYRQRKLVERFFNKIKQFRGVATRCDKGPIS